MEVGVSGYRVCGGGGTLGPQSLYPGGCIWVRVVEVGVSR